MRLQRKGDRGSALLITIIIVVMVFGIGGAFLVETIYRSRAQFSAMEADDALMTCDAALEKVRLALYQYRFSAENPSDPSALTPWSWNAILQYCNSPTPFYDPATGTFNRDAIRTDYQSTARQTSTLYTTYRTGLMAGTAGLNARMSPNDPANPAMPLNTTAWSPGDVDRGVMLAGNMPYLDGAYYIHVRDNDDESALVPPLANDPLVDRDSRIIVTIISTLRDGTQRHVEAVVFYDFTPLTATGLAAVVANSPVETLGSIIVDGNDYDADLGPGGVPIRVGNGVLGIASTEGITMSGASLVGGQGVAPAPAPINGTTTSPNHTFPTGFPSTPDEALGLRNDTLKKAAQRAGTYFTSIADYEAYVGNGSAPSGAIIFIEPSSVDTGSFQISGNNAQINSRPSILVIHNSSKTGEVFQVHGNFKGLMLADQVTRVNAGTLLLGAVMTFSESLAGNTFGNGNSEILFSSEALANLPQPSDGAVRVLSWRKIL
jgi:type II secretory pathway pseudopilin PulG